MWGTFSTTLAAYITALPNVYNTKRKEESRTATTLYTQLHFCFLIPVQELFSDEKNLLHIFSLSHMVSSGMAVTCLICDFILRVMMATMKVKCNTGTWQEKDRSFNLKNSTMVLLPHFVVNNRTEMVSTFLEDCSLPCTMKARCFVASFTHCPSDNGYS